MRERVEKERRGDEASRRGGPAEREDGIKGMGLSEFVIAAALTRC